MKLIRGLPILSLFMIILLMPIGSTAYSISGSYTNLQSEEVSFSTFEGKPLIVEAFATDCEHCHDQHPDLVTLWNEYNDSMSMLSLSISDGDDIETIESYLEDFPSPWSIGLDKDGEFQSKYGLYGTPTILLFDSEGNLASCDLGRQEYTELQTSLDNFLADPSGYKANNEGACPQTSFLQQFMGSIFFPIFAGLLVGGLYLLVTKYRSS